jgi:parallel beta-helix repeat protein
VNKTDGWSIKLLASQFNEISWNNISHTGCAIGLYDSSNNNTVFGNIIDGAQTYGIHVEVAYFNIMFENSVRATGGQASVCVVLKSCSNNLVYHNNILKSEYPWAGDLGSNNKWDNGYPSGGNYWSNYNGKDANHDGIGDTPYFIETNSTDNYPLMGTFSDFNVASDQHVTTICDSVISDFQFTDTAIMFNVTGVNGTTGFCRICIPTELMNATYRVFIDGTEVSYSSLSFSNSTYSYLYFNYVRSTRKVVIISEFPSFLILPLFMIATMLVVVLYRMKNAKVLWLNRRD